VHWSLTLSSQGWARPWESCASLSWAYLACWHVAASRHLGAVGRHVYERRGLAGEVVCALVPRWNSGAWKRGVRSVVSFFWLTEGSASVCGGGFSPSPLPPLPCRPSVQPRPSRLSTSLPLPWRGDGRRVGAAEQVPWELHEAASPCRVQQRWKGIRRLQSSLPRPQPSIGSCPDLPFSLPHTRTTRFELVTPGVNPRNNELQKMYRDSLLPQNLWRFFPFLSFSRSMLALSLAIVH
jgi:hypothetical protein